MTFEYTRLRAIALPVILCVLWLFDGKKLIQSIVVVNHGTKIQRDDTFRESYNTTTQVPPQLEIPEDAAAAMILKDDTPFLMTTERKSWSQDSETVKALEEELSKVLTPEQRAHWYETPNFHPYPPRIECPSPKRFEGWPRDVPVLPPLTSLQRQDLRQRLDQSSSQTIRNAFMPWIDFGGIHPDLVLHGGRIAGLLVGIFDNTLYFWGKRHNSAKTKILAEHLESVLYEFKKRKVTLPDIVFPYTVRSIPPDALTHDCIRKSAVPKHLQSQYNTVPVAGIAMDPTIHSGIALMPNMYFGNLAVWDRYTKQFLDGAQVDMPWNKRHRRVFWRGKVDKNLEHNAPRLEAMQAAARDAVSTTHDRHLDITLTSGCDYLEQYVANVTQTSPLAPKWMNRTKFLEVTSCGGDQRTPHAEFTNYWAQLNLPGSSLGSYSKNLQNLWPTGAAVLLWNQSAVEFYYDSLQAGITHTWVNETTLEPTAEILFRNKGKLAQLYGNVAREWFKKHLTMDAILDYYKEWFDAWAALQRFKPYPNMLNDACTCAGWIDADGKKHAGVKRCSYCGSTWPPSITGGCLKMMGDKTSTSLCRDK